MALGRSGKEKKALNFPPFCPPPTTPFLFVVIYQFVSQRRRRGLARVGGPSSSAVYVRTCKNSPRPPPVLRKMRSPFALFVLVFAKVLLLPFLPFSEKALPSSPLFPLTFRWLELHFFAPWLRSPPSPPFYPIPPLPSLSPHPASERAACLLGWGGEG